MEPLLGEQCLTITNELNTNHKGVVLRIYILRRLFLLALLAVEHDEHCSLIKPPSMQIIVPCAADPAVSLIPPNCG